MYKELKSYTSKIKSYHMPGHKNGKISLINEPFLVDVTEVEGIDDLHHATGIIDTLQKQISNIYHSYRTFLLINGSTSGLLAAVAAVTKPEDKVIIGRNCHKSVYNSVMLGKLNVAYLLPDYDLEYQFYKGVNSKELVTSISKRENIKAVVITSPTYEGIVSEIELISEAAHSNGAVLIVDEAHGAHYIFNEYLPNSAIRQGADIVVQSTHKTLPCMTQTALLHVSEEAVLSGRVNINKLQKYLSVYQSSSPSYVLMSSIEKGVKYMIEHEIKFEKLILETKNLISSYNQRQNKYGHWLSGNKVDITRLTYLINKKTGITGWQLAKVLRKQHKIQVELACEHHIIGIVTIADSVQDVNILMDAIDISMSNLVSNKTNTEHEFSTNKIHVKDVLRELPKVQYSIYETTYLDSEKVVLKKAISRVAKEFVIPYPPGIPVIVPGEVFTLELCNKLEDFMINGHEIYGIIEGEVQVIRKV